MMGPVTTDPEIAVDAVLAQLDKVLASEAFQGATRSTTLLAFVVAEAVHGRVDRLKEYTLGAEGLGRGEDFDPRTDPIVRAEASRLRARLERYYAVEGRDDAVVIELPKGSYVPRFSPRPSPAPAIAASPTPSSSRGPFARRRRPGSVAIGLLAVGIATALWFRSVRGRPDLVTEPPLVRLEVELRSDGSLGSEVGTDVVVAPDASRLVFVSRSADGVAFLNTRRLDDGVVHRLPNTEGARVPFFSPDGQWVGFWAGGRIKKIAVNGGSPVVLCDATDLSGASWGEDGTIVAALSFGKLFRVSATSGDTSLIVDMSRDARDPRWPQILPGGKFVLLTAVGPQGPNAANIELLSLADGTRKVVVRGGTFGRYLESGHVTYLNQGTLFALPFALDHPGPPSRTPTPILADVAYSSTFGFGQIDVSRTGVLVYRRSSGRGQLVAAWIDRAGRTEPFLRRPGQYTFPRLSPDGRRLAVAASESGRPSLSIYEHDRDRTTPVRASPAEYSPTWTPDGRTIVLGSRSGLYSVAATDNAQPSPLTRSAHLQVPWSFSPDGTRLAFHELDDTTGFDLWTVRMTATPDGLQAAEPELFLRTAAYETYPSFSPDGRWIAYGSGAFGRWDVYVRPFPNDGSKEVRVSDSGGRIPYWLPNRRELLYRTDDQRLMVAAYNVEQGVFIADTPHEWSPQTLADTGVIANLDVTPDGTRVLGLLPATAEDRQSADHVTMIWSFADELRRRLTPESK
jgi:serine/threonine-protein kinase